MESGLTARVPAPISSTRETPHEPTRYPTETPPFAASCPIRLSRSSARGGTGTSALELTYKSPAGRVANELLYRDAEARIEVVEQGRPWSFHGDGAVAVSEAHRIRLAHPFDLLLAVQHVAVDPLPHQITARDGEMLPHSRFGSSW